MPKGRLFIYNTSLLQPQPDQYVLIAQQIFRKT